MLRPWPWRTMTWSTPGAMETLVNSVAEEARVAMFLIRSSDSTASACVRLSVELSSRWRWLNPAKSGHGQSPYQIISREIHFTIKTHYLHLPIDHRNLVADDFNLALNNSRTYMTLSCILWGRDSFKSESPRICDDLRWIVFFCFLCTCLNL